MFPPLITPLVAVCYRLKRIYILDHLPVFLRNGKDEYAPLGDWLATTFEPQQTQEQTAAAGTTSAS
jgi:hypothetical protein